VQILDISNTSSKRDVLIEGSDSSIEEAKAMIQEIIDNKRQGSNQSMNNKEEYAVPSNMVGLIIGKNGDTIKGINSRTKAFVSLSRDPQHQNQSKAILYISGSPNCISLAKQEVNQIV